MSKLSRIIEAKQTGERFATAGKPNKSLLDDLMCVQENYMDVPTEFSSRYSIGVNIKYDVMIPDLTTAKSNDVRLDIIKKSKEAIVQAVFGEFRDDFARIYHALYNRDFDAANQFVREMETRMFYE